MRTVSLQRRVLVTALGILTCTLIAVTLVVNVLFGRVVDRQLESVLADRVQLAQQLAKQGVSPAQLIQRIDERSVRARLVLANGAIYGSLPEGSAEDNPVRIRRVQLKGGEQLNRSRLTVAVDTGLLAGARSRLLRLLLLTDLVAIAITFVALLVSVRFALSPLDAMTRLARDIAKGGRGRRMSPTRTDTELGRTAAAFDDMLDGLEGAESHARSAEEQTRRFVADAAHELRTPITGVQAVAEAVLQQPTDVDPAERERLHLLLIRESRRAGRLVDELVDLARIDAGGVALERQPVGLYALASTQVDRARLQHPQLAFQIGGAQPIVHADPVRVSQILANLVDNACNATPAGGSVRVTIAQLPGRAEVTIADTGVGVPPADRERIFDRLVRLDRARDRETGGSGLGLAISRGFARAHGGDVTCDPPAEGGAGAVFTLRLPL
ncbi:HAMP domain-containing histidine kinase [Antrihabitans cavernicola]|uniref:histidine kinase n=1 Tax=Antrihabitans cavernicola TaxID=2495913 RepID=A0A5A7SFM2_9NOCA|nr:HAMP domain-containing histidine kinase [Spelaeibacter cavernicola]